LRVDFKTARATSNQPVMGISRIYLAETRNGGRWRFGRRSGCTTRGPAHFDWRWRERPAPALLAWESLFAIQNQPTPRQSEALDLYQAIVHAQAGQDLSAQVKLQLWRSHHFEAHACECQSRRTTSKLLFLAELFGFEVRIKVSRRIDSERQTRSAYAGASILRCSAALVSASCASLVHSSANSSQLSLRGLAVTTAIWRHISAWAR
jgi:hypothetical protein